MAFVIPFFHGGCCAESDDVNSEAVSMTLEEAMDKLESAGIEVGYELS